MKTLAKSESLESTYYDYLRGEGFPCYAAQAALNKGAITTLTLPDLADTSSCQQALESIYGYIEGLNFTDKSFKSFALLFQNPQTIDEETFDTLFWNYLQALHDLDKKHYPPDNRVDANPDAEKFSFSLKSEAFFLIGLHPANSRPGRRFSYPAIVFNAHEQFEQLKESGTFEPLRTSIRNRDKALHGSINPMMQDFGNRSEAFQYTGRKYSNQWKCPFHQ
jgi:FPC/CPF motif-containing protein YcgG